MLVIVIILEVLWFHFSFLATGVKSSKKIILIHLGRVIRTSYMLIISHMLRLNSVYVVLGLTDVMIVEK